MSLNRLKAYMLGSSRLMLKNNQKYFQTGIKAITVFTHRTFQQVLIKKIIEKYTTKNSLALPPMVD